ncbi:MAG: aminopeptidase P family protein [Rhodospirillales bacterium]|nr:aminopeptidase P family protein [Rhodospirillales bacterium]
MCSEGPAELATLLDACDARVGEEAALAIIEGVAAAPPSFDSTAWMHLIADAPSAALTALLERRLNGARDRLAVSSGGDRRARLAALRAEMRAHRLAGYIVPRSDEHQGEYVAARSERLAWISNFTGSAGLAVILRDAAMLLVDGRYTTQAAGEVDAALFTIRHSTRQPLGQLLETTLSRNARLGYDPWLHTPSQIAAFEQACKACGARAVAVEGNLIDRIWNAQPSPPVSPIVPHEGRFAGLTSKEKRNGIAETLTHDRQDAAFLAQPDSVAWLLNIRGGDIPHIPIPLCFALVHADASVDWFVDARKLTSEAKAHLDDGVRVAPANALAHALDQLGEERRVVRVDPEATPAWVVKRLQQARATIFTAPDPCLLPKAVKSGAELAGIRAAHVRDGVALTRFLAWIPGAAEAGDLSESAAADALARLRAENEHYRGLSFPTISASGSHGAIVHYRVSPQSDRAIERGSLYLVDSGAQYLDGTTDVTRTIAIGTPSQEMCERFTLVLKGHIAVATARFPVGTTGSQIDALARVALWREGLDYDHGTGHGVGFHLSVHEGPQRISKLPSRIPLQPGMIVSNEPGYYKPGSYGIRIENLVAVTPIASPEGGEVELHGFDTLTLAPIDRRLIVRERLDAEEIAWLDAYHRRVDETIGPFVDERTRQWLESATRPL